MTIKTFFRKKVVIYGLFLSFLACNEEKSISTENTIYSSNQLRYWKYTNPHNLQKINQHLLKIPQSNFNINWFEVGPNDRGGRIRALCIDRNNSNIIIVGGVTGGIWKSTNSGDSWSLKSNLTDNHHITSIVQHPMNANEWYAVTGEIGSSSGTRLERSYGGGVVYKSSDNGDTWTQVAAPQNTNNYLYLTARLAISPITGTFFVATNGFGIARSTDNGATFDLVLGNQNATYEFSEWFDDNVYVDVAITGNGTLIATLSGELSNGAGFYKSTDDGITWTNITPNDIPPLANKMDIKRTVIAIAPSNPNIAYTWTDVDIDTDNYIYKLDLATNTFQNRSANLPKLDYSGVLYSLPGPQYSYNMAFTVKPDDENFVVLGGASGSPIRTTNGFATDMGVYADWNDILDNSQHYISNDRYDLHNDQHILVFDPNDATKLWVGNDGGIAIHTNVTAVSNQIQWQHKNNGLNIAQFYSLAIAPYSMNKKNQVYGGLQDNGTRVMDWNPSSTSPTLTNIVSGGDGTNCFWFNNYIINFGMGGTTPTLFEANVAQGTGLPEYIFSSIRGFLPNSYARHITSSYVAVNPNNENIIYINNGLGQLYKATNAISWTGMTPTQIEQSLSTFNVSELGFNSNDFGFQEMVYLNNSDKLLFTITSNYPDNSINKPKIYLLNNASTATSLSGALDISSSNFPDEGQIEDITLNPYDDNEFIVVMHNREVESLFHTTNGGQTFESINGNLTIGSLSPVIRCASIIETTTGQKIYLIGTDAGLYSTNSLNGNQTQWLAESNDIVGKCTITDIDFRKEDNMIGIATHGRGIFMGDATNLILSHQDFNDLTTNFNVYPNPISQGEYLNIEIHTNDISNLSISIYDALGKKVRQFNQLKKENNTITLPVIDLSSGNYFLNINKNDKVTHRSKVIVK